MCRLDSSLFHGVVVMDGTRVVFRRVGTRQGPRSSRFVAGVGGRGGRWRSSTVWAGHRSGGEPRVRFGAAVEEEG